MEVDSSNNDSFLDTVEGEISFFRSVMRARPVGIHRHFHVLAIRNAIHRDTGFWASDDDIWRKLKECYELDALEGLVRLIPVGAENRHVLRPMAQHALELRSPQTPALMLGN